MKIKIDFLCAEIFVKFNQELDNNDGAATEEYDDEDGTKHREIKFGERKPSVKTIAHEVHHCVTYICKHHEIEDMETAAYLMGYVFDKVFTLLSK